MWRKHVQSAMVSIAAQKRDRWQMIGGLAYVSNKTFSYKNQPFSYNDMTRLDHWPLGYNVSNLPRFLVQQENLIDQLSPRTTKRDFFQALIFFSYRTFKHLKSIILVPNWPCTLYRIALSIQAFWQGARVRDRTIRSNPHNHAQSAKSRTILKNFLKI